MLPSTIILANIQRKGGSKNDAITAILEYLDEEYEKNQCKHDWHSTDNSLQLSYCKKCKKVEG